MIINDRIMGTFDINESVLVELLNSEAIKRLKKVRQAGVSIFVNNKRNVTRYEHSVAVMLLIKKLGGSLEEQVAGLLHDVSHTAFSHTIDYLENNKEETFHELNKSKLFSFLRIDSLLEKYQIPIDRILNESNYSILEQPQPNICADRIDYSLRDLERENIITLSQAIDFLDHLTIVDGKIVIDDKEIAKWFCESFDKLINEVFLNPLDLYANFYFAKILNIALKEQVIKMSDLIYKDDLTILGILDSCKIRKINEMLYTLRNDMKVEEDEKDFEMTVFSKCRIVDPLILENGKLLRCSSLFPEIKGIHAKTKQISERGLFIKRM